MKIVKVVSHMIRQLCSVKGTGAHLLEPDRHLLLVAQCLLQPVHLGLEPFPAFLRNQPVGTGDARALLEHGNPVHQGDVLGFELGERVGAELTIERLGIVGQLEALGRGSVEVTLGTQDGEVGELGFERLEVLVERLILLDQVRDFCTSAEPTSAHLASNLV